jgi:hypothetical protein
MLVSEAPICDCSDSDAGFSKLSARSGKTNVAKSRGNLPNIRATSGGHREQTTPVSSHRRPRLALAKFPGLDPQSDALSHGSYHALQSASPSRVSLLAIEPPGFHGFRSESEVVSPKNHRCKEKARRSMQRPTTRREPRVQNVRTLSEDSFPLSSHLHLVRKPPA